MRPRPGDVIAQRIQIKSAPSTERGERPPVETVKDVGRGLQLWTRESRREVFHWDSDGVLGKVVFDVSGIKRAIEQNTIEYFAKPVVLDEALYRNVMEKRGVQEWRIAELTAEDIERPGVGLLIPKLPLPLRPEDLFTLTVDGNHRLARRWREGKRDALMNLLPPWSWLPFMAKPDEVERFFTREEE